jgi:hypothetical protein
MANKKYTSYEDIDRDLEILALEKEIQFKKLTQSFDKTKASLSPEKLIGSVPKMAIKAIGTIAGPLKQLGITYLLKKLFRL